MQNNYRKNGGSRNGNGYGNSRPNGGAPGNGYNRQSNGNGNGNGRPGGGYNRSGSSSNGRAGGGNGRAGASQKSAASGTYDVLTVREQNDKKHWTRIGVAFQNEGGSIRVLLDALPLDGTLLLMPPK